MDGNNHTNNGSSSFHFFNPELSQAISNLVRGILSHDTPQPSSTEQVPQQLSTSDLSDTLPTEPITTFSHSETIDGNPDSGSDARYQGTVVSPGEPDTTQQATTPVPASGIPMSSPSAATSTPVTGDTDVQDAEMVPVAETSSSGQSQPNSDNPSGSTRRARVDDEEEEDYWRESNRQRLHAPATHDDEHHFMPIPEDHGVSEFTRDADAPRQDGPPEPPQQGSAPSPQYSRVMWTFDFIPIPNRHPGGNAPAPENRQQDAPADHPQPHHNHHDDDDGTWNFFINLPTPGRGPAPQDGAAPNNGGGFTFPPFPFPFGMDLLQERDDPERAQRLVNGLEEVPAGLVKRMERVGGPGTTRGEAPTCAVCWESLLEPEGGGFEGNAELAKAEAAEAAREDEASQQGQDSSMGVESSASAPLSSSESPSPKVVSLPIIPESTSGDKQLPKIVVLPCSHAFHATCLLPWFSKPGRTTCPSCRFDIDPDSLTYKPRPLRTHPRPRAAPPPAEPQPQPQPLFGLPSPPLFFAVPPQPAPIPPTSLAVAPNIRNTAPAANPNTQPGEATNQDGQERQQPLPPFVTFDISMIIPIFPGRAPGGAAPEQGSNPAVVDGQEPALPPPPRTDRNGFRLDDTFLQEAVRSTFERVFGQPAPPIVPHPPPQGAAAPGENGSRTDRWYTFSGPLPFFPPPMPPLNMDVPPPGAAPRHRSGPRRPAEKQQWAPPPAPGPTLRQVVERNEREMGLRCSDVSCGLGPSDEDPSPVPSMDTSALRQIAIRPLKLNISGETVCAHRFHPACLVSAGRVAGYGQDTKTEDEDVEVSCPVCRAVGVVSGLEWEEGVHALA